MKGADTNCSVNIFVPQTSTGMVLGKLPISKHCSLCTSELRFVPYGNRSRNDKGAINSSAEIIRQRIAGLKVERYAQRRGTVHKLQIDYHDVGFQHGWIFLIKEYLGQFLLANASFVDRPLACSTVNT